MGFYPFCCLSQSIIIRCNLCIFGVYLGVYEFTCKIYPLWSSQIPPLDVYSPPSNVPPKRPDKYSDGNGLELWVRHTGNKVWYADYTFGGKRTNLAIGKYPALTLAQARLKNQEIKSQIAQGIDPKQKAHQDKIKRADNSFDVFAQKWLDHQQTHIKPITFKRDKFAYHNHIAPIIGAKDIYSLKLSDIMVVHDRLAQAGKTNLAHRVMTWINAIYDYAIEKGLADGLANPIPKSIHKSLAEHKTKHHTHQDNPITTPTTWHW